MLFHSEDEISLGLRRLALSPYYRKYFDFYQMKKPPKQRLEQLGIKRLSKLVLFMADPILLAEPDTTPPIDKVSFELGFIYDNLKMFLDDMIAEHGRFLQEVPQIRSEADIDALLRATGKRYYLIFAVDKDKEAKNEQLVDRLNDMLILNKLAGRKAASAYVDIGCFPYLTELFRFREKDAPLLVVYDSQTGSYLRADSRLNVYDGRELIEKAVLRELYQDRFRPAKLELGPSRCGQKQEEVDL